MRWGSAGRGSSGLEEDEAFVGVWGAAIRPTADVRGLLAVDWVLRFLRGVSGVAKLAGASCVGNEGSSGVVMVFLVDDRLLELVFAFMVESEGPDDGEVVEPLAPAEELSAWTRVDLRRDIASSCNILYIELAMVSAIQSRARSIRNERTR